MNRRWHPYIDHLILVALAVISYLLFFHQLGNIGMIGPDEPRYASIARTMFETGDYITPRLNGEVWFEKPVLMYWGAAIGYKIFGVNEWGARFPSALAATVCVFLLYWCGRRLWDRATGFWAAVIMASSVGFFAFSRAASMDLLLTACLTSALVFFIAGIHEQGPRRLIWFYLFYVAVGLGALAKGPIAFFLPAASLVVFLMIRGRWNDWRSWHPEGIALAFGVSLPWYLACTWVNGYQFIQIFIINHNLERFATTVHGHQRPFYFYLPVLLLLTFPWTFLMIPTVRRQFSRYEQVMVWWAIVPFLFFSLAGSKLPGYILPMVPPIALLCARELMAPIGRALKVAIFIEAGTMAFIGVGFGFFGNMINVDPHVGSGLIAVVAFGLAAVLIVIGIWPNSRVLASFNAAVMIALVVLATTIAFPRFDITETMRPWAQALERIVPANQVVFMYRPTRSMEYGLQYYRSNNARGVGSAQELAAVVGSNRVLCLAEDKALKEEVATLGGLDMEVVHTIGNQSAFWVWATH